jgi:hypothetical protein
LADYIYNHTWKPYTVRSEVSTKTKPRISFLVTDFGCMSTTSGGNLKTFSIDFTIQNTGEIAEVKRLELCIDSEEDSRLLKAPFYLERGQKTEMFHTHFPEKDSQKAEEIANTKGECLIFLVLRGYLTDLDQSFTKVLSLVTYSREGKLEQHFDKFPSGKD